MPLLSELICLRNLSPGDDDGTEGEDETFIKILKLMYYVFHGRVTLFFADNFSTECRINMELLHYFFRP